MIPKVLENLMDLLFQQGQGFIDYRVRGTSGETTVTLKFSTSHDSTEVKQMNSKAKRDRNRISRFNEQFDTADSGNNTQSSFTSSGQSSVSDAGTVLPMDLNPQSTSTPHLNEKSTQIKTFPSQEIEGPYQIAQRRLVENMTHSTNMNTQQSNSDHLETLDSPLEVTSSKPGLEPLSQTVNINNMDKPLHGIICRNINDQESQTETGGINSSSEQRDKAVQCTPYMRTVETQRTLSAKSKSTDTIQLMKLNHRNVQTGVTEDDLSDEEETTTEEFNEMCQAALERSLLKFDSMFKLDTKISF